MPDLRETANFTPIRRTMHGLLLWLMVILSGFQLIQPAAILAQETTLVTQEIRYTLPEAGEVILVWRDNRQGLTHEDIRPVSRIMKKSGTLHKPMTLENGLFVARLQAPVRTSLIYGFWITKDLNGLDIEPVWDGRPGYQALLIENKIIEIVSPVTLLQNQEAEDSAGPSATPGEAAVEETEETVIEEAIIEEAVGEMETPKPGETADPPADLPAPPLVAQEIRYHAPEAGSVSLIWGVNGWAAVPAELQPPGTIINERKLMVTPMERQAETFVAKLQAPADSNLQFGFLITKDSSGTEIKPIWDGHDDYRLVLKENNTTEIETAIDIEKNHNSKTSPAAPEIADNSGTNVGRISAELEMTGTITSSPDVSQVPEEVGFSLSERQPPRLVLILAGTIFLLLTIWILWRRR